MWRFWLSEDQARLLGWRASKPEVLLYYQQPVQSLLFFQILYTTVDTYALSVDFSRPTKVEVRKRLFN